MGIGFLFLVAAALLADAGLYYYGFWWRTWRKRRRALAERLLRAGVLSPRADEGADAFVRLRSPAASAWRRWTGRADTYAFVWREGRALRFAADEPFVAGAFRMEEGCSRDCSGCGVAWACGGRDFPLHLWVNGQWLTVLVRALGGDTAGDAARAQAAFRALLTSDPD